MRSVGEGKENDLERAEELVANIEAGKSHNIHNEILAFIRRPELRSVAESLLKCAPSFSQTTALRKLLEADEALRRAGAIHLAYQHKELDAQIAAAKEEDEKVHR